MPTNIYGPHDNYGLMNSHGFPDFLRKFHDAKVDGTASVTVWGSTLRALGWTLRIGLQKGLEQTYVAFFEESENGAFRDC